MKMVLKVWILIVIVIVIIIVIPNTAIINAINIKNFMIMNYQYINSFLLLIYIVKYHQYVLLQLDYIITCESLKGEPLSNPKKKSY